MAGVHYTNEILPLNPTTFELFFRYLRILLVVTVIQNIVLYVYVRYFGSYE